MTARSLARPRKIEQLGAKIALLWAGLSIGVAFLATPAKFTAPSLTLIRARLLTVDVPTLVNLPPTKTVPGLVPGSTTETGPLTAGRAVTWPVAAL